MDKDFIKTIMIYDKITRKYRPYIEGESIIVNRFLIKR